VVGFQFDVVVAGYFYGESGTFISVLEK